MIPFFMIILIFNFESGQIESNFKKQNAESSHGTDLRCNCAPLTTKNTQLKHK